MCACIVDGCAVIHPHILTIRLIKAMKAHRRMHLEMNSLHNKQDGNMTSALVMVVIVFIICHVPNTVLSFLPLDPMLTRSEVWFIVKYISQVLLILNSAVNFAIYTLANKRFREVLTKTICRRHRPTEGRAITARQMARAEVARGELDDINDTPI